MQCSCGLCADCDRTIHRNAIFKSHHVVSLNVGARDGASSYENFSNNEMQEVDQRQHGELEPLELRVCCSKHPQDQLTLFCRTCKFAICKLCAVDVHRTHKITSCSEEVPLIKSNVPSLVSEMSRVNGKCRHVLERVSSAKSEVEDQYQRSINTIEDKMTKYMQLLQSRRLTLLNSLQEEFSLKMKMLDEQETTLRDAMTNARQAVCIVNSLFQTGCESDDDECDSSKKERRLLLPSNRTESVVCDIGFSIPEVVSYSSTQRLDSTACVDTNIAVSFSRHELQLQTTIMSLGDIQVLRSRGRMFPYSGDPCANDGVISYYGCDRGIKIYQNPVQRDLVRLLASGVGYGRLENVVSCERSEFCTTEPASAGEQSWVVIILEAPVIVSHYRLGHDTFDEGGHFIRSWKLEGRTSSSNKASSESMSTSKSPRAVTTSPARSETDACPATPAGSRVSDAEGWITLDDRHNDLSLNPRSLLCVFETPKTVVDQRIACNEIRLTQTGSNSERTGHLMITAMELFGELLGK